MSDITDLDIGSFDDEKKKTIVVPDDWEEALDGAPQRLQLSDEKKAELISRLKRDMEIWELYKGDLDSKIIWWNDMVEGVMPAKTEPWEGSANIHVPLQLIHIKGAHNIACGTLLDSDPVMRVNPVKGMDNRSVNFARKAERFIHNKLIINERAKKVLSRIFWLAFQEGLCVAKIFWESRRRKVKRVFQYNEMEQFSADFPDAGSAGVSAGTYADLRVKLAQDGKLSVMTEIIEVSGKPRIIPVQLADVVTVPYDIPDEKEARTVGDRYWQTLNDIRVKAVSGYADPNVVDELTLSDGKDSEEDDVHQAKYEAAGISSIPGEGPRRYQTLDAIVLFDEDGDGIDEEIFVSYLVEEEKLLCVYPYALGFDNLPYIFFRPFPRPLTIPGRSFCEILDDISTTVDTLLDQRLDNISIKNNVSFKGKSPLTIDGRRVSPEDARLRFKPGTLFLLDDPDSLQQFQIQDIDFSSSFRDQENLIHLADVLTAVTQGLSGASQGEDPRSPASKYLAQLNQAREGQNGYLRELADSLEQLVRYWLMLYFTNSPKEDIEFYYNDPESKEMVREVMEKAQLNPDTIFLSVSRPSVSNNPEAEFQKAVMLFQMMMPVLEKVAPQQLQSAIKMLVMSSNFAPAMELIPTNEQLGVGAEPGANAGAATPPGAVPVQPASPMGMQEKVKIPQGVSAG